MRYYIEPWAHQHKAIEFSHSHPDVALFWEMGTGKTATTINILRHKYLKHDTILSTLIFAPIVVLENWKAEFKAHGRVDDRKMVMLKGTGKQKAKQIMAVVNAPDKNLIIIGNYEIMQSKEVVAALTLWAPKIMVCDESHRCKSYKSVRARAIAKLSAGCKYRYLLSGTPVLNSPMDVFMQFKILDGGKTFGSNFWIFQKEYFYDANAGMPSHVHFPNWKPKPGIYKRFNELLSTCSLRATKEECLDLPPFIRETRFVEMNPEQKKAYNEMRNDFVTYIKDEACVAQLAITKGLRLQQIVSGFIKTDDGNTVRFAKTPREKELETLLGDLTPTSKVIVWACFKENYKQIAEICTKLDIGYAQLHGGIKDKESELVQFRENDRIRVMIANPQSAGLGVNLIEAGYSVYYSKNFSLEADLQSEARNHRGGSEKLHDKITRIDLVAKDTLDEQVTAALASKQNVASAILDWEI